MKNSSLGVAQIKNLDVLEARFALRVAARLHERARDVEPDIAERLRVAREQALGRARELRTAERQAAGTVAAAGNAAALGGGSSWWVRIASIAPFVALVIGLMLIDQWQTQSQIEAAAEVDSALLADDLPPDAYSDPGFAEFLKVPRD